MTHHFEADIVHAVLAHMNDDHADDNRIIVHAFADASASDITMVGLDGDGGDWTYADAEGNTVRTRIPWPREVVERPDIRRAVVELHTRALEQLGLPPRSHDQ